MARESLREGKRKEGQISTNLPGTFFLRGLAFSQIWPAKTRLQFQVVVIILTRGVMLSQVIQMNLK